MATQPEVKADAGFGPEPQLTVAQTALHADPGGAAQTQITLRHGGNRVEGFALDVVGLPQAWWRVEPPLLELLPGTSGTAVVEFRPPAGTPAPDAPLPFGVRATSALDASRSVVEEGDLEVGRQLSLTAEIAPLTSRARWRGRHVVTFTNWGNAPIDLALTGRDRDGRLAFLFAPAALKVPIGGTANSRLKARIRRPVLRGQREQIPFQVVATGPGGTPVPGAPGTPGVPGVPAVGGVPGVPGAPAGARTLDAVVEQRPVLSNVVLVALGLVALLVAALVAWLLRLPAVAGAREPTVEPPVPTGVKLVDFSGGRASLSWKKNDYAQHRVDVYAGQPQPGVEPVLSIPVAPYAFSAVFTVKDAKPGQRYCFQVTAVDGDSASGPSKPECALTKPAPLAAPKTREPKAVPGGKALVAWEGDPSTTYEVASTSAEGAPDGAVRETVKGKSQIEVPVRPGLNCFAVTAVKGGQRSRPSDPPACLTVEPEQVQPTNRSPGEPASPSPSTSPSQSASPSDSRILRGWLVPLDTQPVEGGDVRLQRPRAERAVQALKAAGYSTANYQLFDPREYPVIKKASFIAYAMVARDEATANSVCSRLRTLKQRKDSPFAEFYGCEAPLLVPGTKQ